MDVPLLYVHGCPSWELADRRLRALEDELGFPVERRRGETLEDAERVGFRRSPMIPVDGRDPVAEGDEPVGRSCRLHRTPDGLAGAPTVE
ncbi:MAG: thioredoxin family protein [Actinobacteria bacterium]|nr:thioredoxin family protein [Actinomycetota bacterium]